MKLSVSLTSRCLRHYRPARNCRLRRISRGCRTGGTPRASGIASAISSCTPGSPPSSATTRTTLRRSDDEEPIGIAAPPHHAVVLALDAEQAAARGHAGRAAARRRVPRRALGHVQRVLPGLRHDAEPGHDARPPQRRRHARPQPARSCPERPGRARSTPTSGRAITPSNQGITSVSFNRINTNAGGELIWTPGGGPARLAARLLVRRDDLRVGSSSRS